MTCFGGLQHEKRISHHINARFENSTRESRGKHHALCLGFFTRIEGSSPVVAKGYENEFANKVLRTQRFLVP